MLTFSRNKRKKSDCSTKLSCPFFFKFCIYNHADETKPLPQSKTMLLFIL
ncbi:hypothetical protein QUC31_014002 [Theobroma cacao]